MEVLGVDAGNSNIKIIGKKGKFVLPAALGEFRERKLKQKFSDDDIVYEYNGRKGFAGTLAKYESQLLTSRMGDSKAHEEMLIRALIGISKYSPHNQFSIVVGQPISKHIELEKDKMKELLLGKHEIIINNVKRSILIANVEIASEAGAAFWSNPKKGRVGIIDIGSGTINSASLIDGKYIDKDSFTINEGLETLLVNDMESLARKIALYALRFWNPQDTVLLCGGGANELLPYLKKYFQDISLLQPRLKLNDSHGEISFNILDPVFANAVGYYNIAKKVFKNVLQYQD